MLETINAFENTENLDPKQHRQLIIIKRKLLERKAFIEGFKLKSEKEILDSEENMTQNRESYIIGKEFSKARETFAPMNPPRKSFR